MSSKVDFTTFDCHDPRGLAGFWATALAYEIEAPNENAGEVLLVDPTGAGPSLGFMKVPESKVVKNRVHLDLTTDGPSRRRSSVWSPPERASSTPCGIRMRATSTRTCGP